MCHCHACQRRTGSPFGAQARFPDDRVTVEGRATEYVRTAESGNEVHFFFCPACGSTVYYRLAALPGATAIPIGAFADETFPPPKISIYEARRHPWVTAPGDAERLD